MEVLTARRREESSGKELNTKEHKKEKIPVCRKILYSAKKEDGDR